MSIGRVDDYPVWSWDAGVPDRHLCVLVVYIDHEEVDPVPVVDLDELKVGHCRVESAVGLILSVTSVEARQSMVGPDRGGSGRS